MDGTLWLALIFSASLHLTFLDPSPRSGPLPLDVLLNEQRLYEPPATFHFAVVTPFHPDNQEAGVELRCNAQAVASTVWTLDAKSRAVREFDWKLRDENCLYELVVVLTRTKDYVYIYQMVPSRAWLSYRMPSRQTGQGRLVAHQ